MTGLEHDHYTAPEWAASALVTIDVQRDTLDGAPLEIPGTSAALPQMRLLLDAFRAAGRPVVHVVRLYEPDGANVDICRRRLVQDGARILAPDATGSQLARELQPDLESQPDPGLQPGRDLRLDARLLLGGGVQPLGAGEVAIYKPRWGAFYGTPLEEHLREHGVSTLVFCGCNFPNCPRTSIYQASERDYRVVLANDAVSGIYERGEEELRSIGVQLMSATEITSALARTVPLTGPAAGTIFEAADEARP